METCWEQVYTHLTTERLKRAYDKADPSSVNGTLVFGSERIHNSGLESDVKGSVLDNGCSWPVFRRRCNR